MSIKKENIHLMRIGILGLSIPVLFVISFLVFFIAYNPNAITLNIKDRGSFIFLTAFNIEGIPGQRLVAYFNYAFIGLLIIIFCVTMLLKSGNHIIDRIAKLFLLISGFSWMIQGFNELTKFDGYNLMISLIATIITLLTGIVGYTLFAFGEEININNNGVTNRSLLLGIVAYIIIEYTLKHSINNYPMLFSYSSWLVYFLGFAILGLNLIKKSSIIDQEGILDFENL